jgi:hypothetical protein
LGFLCVLKRGEVRCTKDLLELGQNLGRVNISNAVRLTWPSLMPIYWTLFLTISLCLVSHSKSASPTKHNVLNMVLAPMLCRKQVDGSGSCSRGADAGVK